MIYFAAFLIFAAAAGVSLRYNWWRIPQGWHKARVLMYHSVEEHKGDKFDKWRLKPADFERQIAWLAKNGFESFKLSELIALERLPKKAVCITFDDGFENNFTSAFEILKKYDFKASIFLVPDAVQNDWERANTTHLARMLSEEQILKMQASGLVEFGAHTMHHVNLDLTYASDPQLAADEIIASKARVARICGRPCEVFAYPYGKFNDEILNIARSNFKGAVVVKRGLYVAGDDKYAVKRIGILGTEGFFDFWLKFTRIRNKL